MNSQHFTALFALVCCTVVTPAVAADEPGSSAYDVVSQATRKLDRRDGSDFVKILVEAANLGGDEVEVVGAGGAEVTPIERLEMP